MRLMPGHAASLEFPFDSRGDGRQQIRGFIIEGGIDDPNTKNRRGTLLGTVEVFDSETGRTQFLLPGTASGGPSPHM